MLVSEQVMITDMLADTSLHAAVLSIALLQNRVGEENLCGSPRVLPPLLHSAQAAF